MSSHSTKTILEIPVQKAWMADEAAAKEIEAPKPPHHAVSFYSCLDYSKGRNPPMPTINLPYCITDGIKVLSTILAFKPYMHGSDPKLSAVYWQSTIDAIHERGLIKTWNREMLETHITELVLLAKFCKISGGHKEPIYNLRTSASPETNGATDSHEQRLEWREELLLIANDWLSEDPTTLTSMDPLVLPRKDNKRTHARGVDVRYWRATKQDDRFKPVQDSEISKYDIARINMFFEACMKDSLILKGQSLKWLEIFRKGGLPSQRQTSVKLYWLG